MALIRKRRQRGGRVSDRFIRINAISLVKEHYPNANFKCSYGWRIRFRKRNNLFPRRAQKNKKKSAAERAPALKYWHRCFKKMISEPREGDAYFNSKWGRFPPCFRFNVDQVPLPFVVDQDKTMHIQPKDPTLEWLLILERIYKLACEDERNPPEEAGPAIDLIAGAAAAVAAQA